MVIYPLNIVYNVPFPSGKRTWRTGKSPFIMGKLINSYVKLPQGLRENKKHIVFDDWMIGSENP